MKTTLRPLAPTILALVLTLGACTTDPVSHSGFDETEHISSDIWGTGSAHIAPADDSQNLPDTKRVPRPLTEKFWPEIPFDRLDAVKAQMTERELLDLLGEPDDRGVQKTDIDTADRDWNARVYTWKYQDSRLTKMEMTRDFEVHLSYLHPDHRLTGRDEVVGPAWIVRTTELR